MGSVAVHYAILGEESNSCRGFYRASDGVDWRVGMRRTRQASFILDWFSFMDLVLVRRRGGLSIQRKVQAIWCISA